MSIRKILSARAARPMVEEMMASLVNAAVYIGGADGRFGEDELNVFIDSMREVVSSAVGESSLESLASTGRLLDQARAARKDLHVKGHVTFLTQLAHKFPPHFARDGLVLAYRIVLADGKVTDKEAAAFEALASALGVETTEIEVLKEMATHSETSSRQGHRGTSIELVQALETEGWTRLKDDHFDAGVLFKQADGGLLSLELDSGESVLHVHVNGAEGKGPHLVCFFGDALPALLAVVNGLKSSLRASSLGEKLPAIRAVCSEVFVEHQGKFARV